MIKTALRGLLRTLVSSPAIFRAAAGSGLHVFLFHDVSPAPAEFSARHGLNIEPGLFRQHLRWIKAHFEVISPADLAQGRVPPNSALITFDDGLAGYFDSAVPVLEEEHVPSMIFLNMAPVDGAVFWSGLATYLCEYEPEFRTSLMAAFPHAVATDLFLYATPGLVRSYLDRHPDAEGLESKVRAFYGAFVTETRLRDMSRHAGSVYFGNHLFNHYNAAVLRDDELIDAYEANVRRLREYPNFIDFFSYPYGQPGTCYDARTERVIAAQRPLKTFSALPLRNSDPGAHLVHRIALDESIDSVAAFRFRTGILPRVNGYRRTARDSALKITA